ncbi:TPA: helix-turn-helix transcriptional regulator [Clostridioides difficile]
MKRGEKMNDIKRHKLYELRHKLGITQKNVAENAKISRSSYSLIESGRRNPSVTVAINISKALNVSLEDAFPDEIFFGKNVTI